MIHPLFIELEAHHHDRNVHRFYTLEVLPNLFGLYSLQIRYGRKNTKASPGQKKTFILDTQEQVFAKVKQILQKRFSSLRRIGVPHSITYANEPALKLIQACDEQGMFINKAPLVMAAILPLSKPNKIKKLLTKPVDNPHNNPLLPFLNPLPINASLTV